MSHIHVNVDSAYVKRPIYKDLMDLPGSSYSAQVSGILTAIAIVSGQGYHYFKVTIDGNPIVDEVLCGGGRWINNSIGLNLPFSRSLKVEIADYNPSLTPRFWVSCFVSGCDMIKRGKPTPEKIDGVNFAYRTDLFQTDTGEQYEVKYSSGVWSRSEVSVDVDAYRAGKIKLRGSVSVQERNMDNPEELTNVSYSDVVLMCRPAGELEPSVEVGRRAIGGRVEGQKRFEWDIEYLPPGEYEIIADIPKPFANKPALIRVL